MSVKRISIVPLVSVLALSLGQCLAAQGTPQGKKLIEWGWDEPDTKFMRQNVEKMEQFPFDGLIFHALSGKGGNLAWEMWGNRKFELAEFQHAIDDLGATRFRRLTDRFLRVNVTPGNVDWFDDQAWAVVLHNFTVASQVAKQGGCKGVMFDVEQYKEQLFHYGKQRHRADKAFADYRAKVRQRGQEWIRAVNGPFPDVTVLLTFAYSITGGQPKDRAGAGYGLLGDFLDGVLDACSPQTKIVDAWEGAYTYKSLDQFQKAHEAIRDRLADLAADTDQYRRRIRAGFGIWMDCNWRQVGWRTDDFSKNHFTPAEFENSVRWALQTSDEYVWIYTEQPRWWTNERLPKAYVDALAKAREGSPQRPNVVVILTDDQRWDAMSCAGHPFLKTPNIDRIAHEGVRFANAFVTTSLCSPSRASLLSGRYAHSHKVLNNFTDYPADLPSYPRRLRASGYETAYVGKWHMGEQSDQWRPGFDHWMSHKGQGNYFDNEFNIDGQRRVIKGYYTHVVADHAVEWLKRPHEKPFLLILGQKAPHGGPIVPEPKYEHVFDNVPIQPPPTARDYGPGKPEWLKLRVPTWHGIDGPLYGLKEFGKFVRYYCATLVSVEESVGRIFQALEETGQLDNTILVYTSDNGFFLGEHGCVDKRAMYEESIRVPLLVRCPKLIPKPTVVQEMILNIDLAPSLLDLCGVKPLKGIHGRSWKPLLQGDNRGWRKSWLYAYNFEKEFPYTPNVRGVRTDEWKYVHYPHGDGSPDRYKAELYNLEKDPRETRNLIDDPAAVEKLQELRTELDRLLRETGAAPDPMPIDEGVKNVLPKY